MLRQEDGQITVFLSLLFLVLLGVVLCVMEGMYSFMESSLAEDSLKGAGNYVLASYNRDLFERYHLFFLDPREKGRIEDKGKQYLSENLACGNMGIFQFSCSNLEVTEEHSATDEKGTYVKHQIREWMKYKEITNAAEALKKLFASADDAEKGNALAKADMDEAQADIDAEAQIDDAKEDEEKETGEESDKHANQTRVEWKEVRKLLQSIVQSGILLYVTDEVGSLSKLSISMEELPSGQQGAEQNMKEFFSGTFSFLNVSEWKKLLADMQDGEWSSEGILDEFYLLQYIEECFGCYVREGEKESALEYEIEYLIAGKDSDVQNLKSVAEHILCLRLLLNYSYLSQDQEWRAVSGSIAAALTGVLGFPQAKKAVEILLTAAVSFGESMLDVHALLDGEKVPVMKDSSSWNLKWENAVSLLKNKGPVKQGKVNVSYEDYLKFFLATRIKRNQLLFRIMDMMQLNLALKEPDFLMKECLFSFRWKADFTCGGFFHFFPGVGQKREGNFTVNIQRVSSY